MSVIKDLEQLLPQIQGEAEKSKAIEVLSRFLTRIVIQSYKYEIQKSKVRLAERNSDSGRLDDFCLYSPFSSIQQLASRALKNLETPIASLPESDGVLHLDAPAETSVSEEPVASV
jgi:hypothetical protein